MGQGERCGPNAQSFLPTGGGFPWLNEPASGKTNGWEELACFHVQRRRKLPAWCDVPSFGRCRTVRYPLVRAPCTTPTNAQVATLQWRRKLPAWVVRLGALVRPGNLDLFKALASARVPGRRPKRTGATWWTLPWERRRSVPYPKAEAGDTPRYLEPHWL